VFITDRRTTSRRKKRKGGKKLWAVSTTASAAVMFVSDGLLEARGRLPKWDIYRERSMS
jgi:hypothetical protein